MNLLIGKEDGRINHYKQANCDTIAFGHLLTGNSFTKSYCVKANNLSANLDISCTGIYQISLSENSGYSQSLSIAPNSGSVSDTVFVNFQPTAEQEYTCTITHTSTGIDAQEITVTGYGQESADKYPGSALDFDGMDDYVNCGTSTQITGNNPRTIEAWAYAESFNNGGVFQAGAPGTNLADFSLRTLTAYEHWRVQLWGNDMDVTLDYSKNSWHHYCLTYDGTTVKFYYDGELYASKDVILNTASHDIYFGRWQDSYFDGKIDEVRIWNTARSVEEIRENMYLPLTGNETGLVSNYQFNEGNGNLLTDYVSGNEGTLTNMTDDDWVTSLITFGPGYSDTEFENVGIINFTNTGFSTNLDHSVAGVFITVTRIDTTPNMNPQDVDTVFDNQYWVVNRYPKEYDNSYGDLIFTVSEDLTEADESDPSHIALYTRGSNSSGNWIYLTNANSVNAADNTATFTVELSGFNQFIIARMPQNIELDLTVFLEGPYNGTDMNIDLNPGEIPLAQPYNVSPWNYTGTESVTAIPANTVDWVLVELRDTTDASLATGETMIARQAAFLLNDGKIVGLDGSSNLQFDKSLNHSLFTVIHHRNHLAVMSANPVTKNGNVYTYDFTISADQAYGTNAQKDLGSGVYGMI